MITDTNLFVEPFSTFQPLPTSSFQTYIPRPSGQTELAFGTFSAQETLDIFWLLYDCEINVSLDAFSNLFIFGEEGGSTQREPDSQGSFNYSFSQKLSGSSLPLPEPKKRLSLNGNFLTFSDTSGYFSLYIYNPQYAMDYGDDVPFESRMFVFPVSIFLALQSESEICLNATNSTKNTLTIQNTYAGNIETNFFGKTVTFCMHAYAPYAWGEFENSGSASIVISNPKKYIFTQ